MNFPVIKAASYILIHANNIMLEHGTTLTMEKKKNPDSDYLKAIHGHLRTFDEAVCYAPNQVYIGNIDPPDLDQIPRPWYDHPLENKPDGSYGEILDEFEFYGLLKTVDSFDLVELSSSFAPQVKEKLQRKNMFTEQQLALFEKGMDTLDIAQLVEGHKAEGLYWESGLVGCVRAAHESDPNLSSHVVFENLVSKASAVLALNNLLIKNKINPEDIEYIIETSEEAVGDMNQRGGGNLAKAIGEKCGLINATGIDMRGFCAGPAHGLVNAAALVQAGIFSNVVVLAGGSTAKLGMNSRDHIAKGSPVLEDMIGGYAVLVSANDGVNPIIRTDIIGRHKIGSGSAPQAVIQAIVVDPLEKNNIRLNDIDIYAPELQNPEITVPAGAGDVPLANYKMIGAMAVKRGEIEKNGLLDFCKQHGVTGFAPTQGHIPSGVPIIGYVCAAILKGEMQKAMLIGKGSLFLGRMTDLFDGISFIIEKNPGMVEDQNLAGKEMKQELKELVADAMQDVAENLAGR